MATSCVVVTVVGSDVIITTAPDVSVLGPAVDVDG